MEIYMNLLKLDIDFLKNEFISSDTKIEELIYLKKVINIRIKELIEKELKKYKGDE